MIKVNLTTSSKVQVSSTAGIILFAPEHIIIPAKSMSSVNSRTSIDFDKYFPPKIQRKMHWGSSYPTLCSSSNASQYYGRVTNVGSMLKNRVFVTESFIDTSEEITVWLVNMSDDSVSITENTAIAQVIFEKKQHFKVSTDNDSSNTITTESTENNIPILPIDTFQWPAPIIHRLPQSN